ncbi:MAG TPA: ribosome biogenesis GTP-binding protein YihA/YsxC [Chitinophagaceae bacterium]|nr:ribosome biogenesis GTP-binding protein YihA/YsxC [Chitinophagaceae bacterium]
MILQDSCYQIKLYLHLCASSGIGMQIKGAKYSTSSPSVEKCPAADRPEIAFIGRSNVGKSSLINMLCNNSALAKISSTPGKTQLINHFEITSPPATGQKMNRGEKQWYLVDLPGYGFAKVSQSSRRRWEQMIEGYLRKRKNLSIVFLLIDSRHAPQKIDLDFVDKLGKWQIPFALVFTKTDKNKPAVTENNINLFMQALEQSWEQPPNFFLTSAITKEGRKEMLDYIWQFLNHAG